MKAKVIYQDKSTNRAELSHAKALELSKLESVAAIVCHETMRMQTVYAEGKVMQYDPVTCKLV